MSFEAAVKLAFVDKGQRERLIRCLLRLSQEGNCLTDSEIAELRFTGLWDVWGKAVKTAQFAFLKVAAADPRAEENALFPQEALEDRVTLFGGITFRMLRQECFRALLHAEYGLNISALLTQEPDQAVALLIECTAWLRELAAVHDSYGHAKMGLVRETRQRVLPQAEALAKVPQYQVLGEYLISQFNRWCAIAEIQSLEENLLAS